MVGAFGPKVARHCTTKIGQLNSRSVAKSWADKALATPERSDNWPHLGAICSPANGSNWRVFSINLAYGRSN